MNTLKYDIIAHEPRNGKDTIYHIEFELDGKSNNKIRRAIGPNDYVQVSTDKDGKLTAVEFPKYIIDM